MRQRTRIEERKRPPTVVIQTHGCKLNAADSQVLASEFVGAGCVVVEDIRDADIYVLNTCTVTAQADIKARKALRAAARLNPSILLSATGCYIQRRPDDLVDLTTQAGSPVLLGNAKKDIFVNQVLEALPLEPIKPAILPTVSTGSKALNRTRAMIKIQEGCDQVCAYCIVPKVRGREISMPLEGLLEKAFQLSSEGVREIVLTGTQLGTYGHEYPEMDLAELLKQMCNIPTVERLRVSSLQAHEITRELMSLWSDSILCPHFHIPLQSGSDRVLSSMRRRYTREQFMAAVELVREFLPEASITTDVIVGFPGESNEDFQATYQLCEDARLNKIHVFPYSIRPGTSAAYSIDQLPIELIRERSLDLRSLSTELERKSREFLIGRTRSVLWESSELIDDQMTWTGLTEDYVRVTCLTSADLKGTLTQATFLTGDRVSIAQ